MSESQLDASEAPKGGDPGASRTARISLGWSVLRHEPAVNRRRSFRRSADALAYRVLQFLFSPLLPPAALAWRDGYLQGWRDATRRHLEDFMQGMGRSARGGLA
jgi:hypothetical protein